MRRDEERAGISGSDNIHLVDSIRHILGYIPCYSLGLDIGAVAGGAVGGSSKERTTIIPPSLSYARSSTSSLYNHGSMKRATRPSLSKSTYSVEREEDQTMTSTMAWSLLQAIRAIIWLVFALPVIETAVREIRRRRCISALSTRRTNNSVR